MFVTFIFIFEIFHRTDSLDSLDKLFDIANRHESPTSIDPYRKYRHFQRSQTSFREVEATDVR